MTTPADFEFKVIFIGNSSVGKSSLIHRVDNDKFEPSMVSTIGMDLVSKFVQSANHTVKMQLWDTAGQERFRAMVRLHTRGARGVFLVYSVTDQDSFDSIEEYYKGLVEDSTEIPECILVANKIDLSLERVVSTKQGQRLAASLGSGIPFFECSAKSGTGITDALQKMTDSLVNMVKSTQVDYNPKSKSRSSRQSYSPPSTVTLNKNNSNQQVNPFAASCSSCR